MRVPTATFVRPGRNRVKTLWPSGRPRRAIVVDVEKCERRLATNRHEEPAGREKCPEQESWSRLSKVDAPGSVQSAPPNHRSGGHTRSRSVAKAPIFAALLHRRAGCWAASAEPRGRGPACPGLQNRGGSGPSPSRCKERKVLQLVTGAQSGLRYLRMRSGIAGPATVPALKRRSKSELATKSAFPPAKRPSPPENRGGTRDGPSPVE